MVTGGKEGRLKWEMGIDIYTVPYIQRQLIRTYWNKQGTLLSTL